MDEPDIQSLSFEAALAELETIVRSLETGTAPLDESIELYQRGDADGKPVGTSSFDAG